MRDFYDFASERLDVDCNSLRQRNQTPIIYPRCYFSINILLKGFSVTTLTVYVLLIFRDGESNVDRNTVPVVVELL